MSKQNLVAVFCDIMVSKDIMHKTRVSCFTHEIPLYRARFEDRVELCDKQPDKTKELSSVGAEYARLENKHGDGESGSMVEEVYGNRMVGTLASIIGKPAIELMPDDFEDDLYRESNQAAKVKDAPKTAKVKVAGSDTNITKKALVSWLNSQKIEFSEDMNKDDLIAWTFSALPQFIRAAEPGTEIDVDASLTALMNQYSEVTAG